MHTCVQADKACTSTLQTMQCNARQHGREGRERRVFGFRDGYCPGYLELKAWKFLDLAELAVARWRGKEGAFADAFGCFVCVVLLRWHNGLLSLFSSDSLIWVQEGPLASRTDLAGT